MKNLIEILTSSNASQAQLDLVREVLEKDLASTDSLIMSRISELLGVTEPDKKADGKKKTSKKASELTRPERIMKALAKADKALSIAEIIKKSGADNSEQPYFSSTAYRMTEAGKLKRKEVDGIWHYRAN